MKLYHIKIGNFEYDIVAYSMIRAIMDALRQWGKTEHGKMTTRDGGRPLDLLVLASFVHTIDGVSVGE